MDFTAELKLAKALAYEGGPIAIDIQNQGLDVESKGVNDPVTQADKALNELIVSAIREAFPDDAIAAEESAKAGDLNAERVWFVRPIDGTKDFIKRNGEWSVMIGLTVGGRPKVGVVYQPQIDAMYCGVAGVSAERIQKGVTTELTVSTFADASQATIVNSRSHPDARIASIAEQLGVTSEYKHGSVGCKLAQISERRADMYFNLSGRCHMWDTCAPEAIISGAGGLIAKLDGGDIQYSGGTTRVHGTFVATTPALLPQILQITDAMDGLQPE